LRFEIGYFIPVGVDQIENWKDKLEHEIKKIEEIMEKNNLAYVFNNNVEATGVAQFIKENLGETEIIVEISVEPIRSR
jgi:hypothetical protein